jgi:hypothetical protein
MILAGFDQIFLQMINDVESSQEAQDVVTEFNAFLGVS